MPVDKITPRGFTAYNGGLSITEYAPDGTVTSKVPWSRVAENVSWTDFRHAENLAGWRQVIKALDNATTVLYGRRTTATAVPMAITAWYHRKSDGSLARLEVYEGQAVSPDVQQVSNSASTTTADNLAKRHAFRKLKDVHTSFKGATFLGEAGEALRMLRNRSRQIFDGVTDYAKHASSISRGGAGTSSRKRRDNLASLSNLWLERSFGWLPLAGDVSSAIEALNRLSNKKVVSRIKAVGIDKGETVIDEYSTVGNLPFFRQRVESGGVMVIYLIGVSLDSQTSPSVRNPAYARFGFTIQEFVPTLWELTPYSFLVDYFTNIGDILDAGFASTSDVKWVCKTTRWWATRSKTARLDMEHFIASFPAYDVSAVGALGSCITTSTYVERGPAALSAPRLELSVPGFGNPGGASKWFNMAALGISRGISAGRI